LLREYRLLPHLRLILGLGKLAFDAAYDSVKELNETIVTRRPKFFHGAEIELRDNLWLFGSYHPSQQNTFTGKLTVKMWEGVFKRVRERLKG
jgi:uracil-DNA glycosylase